MCARVCATVLFADIHTPGLGRWCEGEGEGGPALAEAGERESRLSESLSMHVDKLKQDKLRAGG